MNTLSAGKAAVYWSRADWRDGMTPNALAKVICCSPLVIASTNLIAWSLYLLFAATPQHWVKERVPCPFGPAGSATTLYFTFGKSFCRAPLIQLPSMVITALPLPNASPDQPASSCFGYLARPVLSMVLTYWRAARFSGVSAVGCLPSLLVSQPPFCTMKAPIRSRVSPSASGTCPLALIFWATAVSCSQVVGTSASVSPALVHRSVLICRARVEKSLGAQ